MDPQTIAEWRKVSNSRNKDAQHINTADHTSVGSAYMTGISVECALKGYLKFKQKSIPKGRSGHDLKNMVSLLNLPLGKFSQNAWFIDEWAVDWRYYRDESELPRLSNECVLAGDKIQKYLLKQIDRDINKHKQRRQR